jgi:hypothetical protein
MSASSKLTQIHQNLIKKIEAKKVEFKQCTDFIDASEKANREINRKLDIYTNRNNNLQD